MKKLSPIFAIFILTASAVFAAQHAGEGGKCDYDLVANGIYNNNPGANTVEHPRLDNENMCIKDNCTGTVFSCHGRDTKTKHCDQFTDIIGTRDHGFQDGRVVATRFGFTTKCGDWDTKQWAFFSGSHKQREGRAMCDGFTVDWSNPTPAPPPGMIPVVRVKNTDNLCWEWKCPNNGTFADVERTKCTSASGGAVSCAGATDDKTVLFGSTCITQKDCTDMPGYTLGDGNTKCVSITDSDAPITSENVNRICGENSCMWLDDSTRTCVPIDSGDGNFGGTSRDRTGRCYRCSQSTYPIKSTDGYWTCGTGLMATMYVMRSCIEHMKPADYKKCVTDALGGPPPVPGGSLDQQNPSVELPVGSECTTDTQCATDLVCTNNRCATPIQTLIGECATSTVYSSRSDVSRTANGNVWNYNELHLEYTPNNVKSCNTCNTGYSRVKKGTVTEKSWSCDNGGREEYYSDSCYHDSIPVTTTIDIYECRRL